MAGCWSKNKMWLMGWSAVAERTRLRWWWLESGSGGVERRKGRRTDVEGVLVKCRGVFFLGVFFFSLSFFSSSAASWFFFFFFFCLFTFLFNFLFFIFQLQFSLFSGLSSLSISFLFYHWFFLSFFCDFSYFFTLFFQIFSLLFLDIKKVKKKKGGRIRRWRWI